MNRDDDRIEEIFERRRTLGNRYDLSNPGNEFNYRQLYNAIEKSLLMLAGDRSLSDLCCLDVGSGGGFWPWQIERMGAGEGRSIATDLLLWRLREGVQLGYRTPRVCCRVEALPFADNSFDVVTQFTLFTSILDQDNRRAAAGDMVRVLRPGGYCLWYDFRYNNPGNPDTRAIGSTELRTLFPHLPIRLSSVTVLPPLARRIPRPMGFLLKLLGGVPMLRSHLFAVIGPKGDG
jgi:ubiquinone/menaquinone biosynthesis C-methylase UbiE